MLKTIRETIVFQFRRGLKVLSQPVETIASGDAAKMTDLANVRTL